MEKEIKELFNKQVVEFGANRFGVAIDELSYIGAWQNFIYEYQKNGESFILRFTPSPHRSEKSVRGELDWIIYLANNEVSVSKPIPTLQGKFTELIDIGDIYFTVTSFVKAEGRKIGYPECLNDNNMYQKLGQITGRMHALSKNYKPKMETIRRHDWNQNYYLKNVENFIPLNQAEVLKGCRKLINQIETSLSSDTDSYGLIHGDIGVGNFVVNDNGITLFDFDEAQYSWFVEDIAIPLYYLVYVYGDDSKHEREVQTNRFMEHFLQGYKLENSIADCWLQQIPLFLRLREIIVYTGMHRSSDVTKLNQWGLDYISQSKKRIENGIPIVNVWD